MQKKVIVIGAGFAGLTASAYLLKNNFKVTVLESSPKLGGRAYSFLNKETKTTIDNGQHILLGCYFETLKFLDLIGASDNFHFQNKLEVNFVKENFHLVPLRTASFLYPINLLAGLLNFKAISLAERFSLLKIFMKLPFYSSNKYSDVSVKQWLGKEKQTENVKEAFWNILAVGALNTKIKKASAKIFIDILKQIFLHGSKAAAIVLPRYGLSDSYCKNAQEFILENGGEIKFSEDAIYHSGKQAFDQGDYESARENFQKLIKKYPNSKNADNAQFWIGEIYYHEKWYEKAILEYQKVIEKYPEGNKVQASLLKQGFSFFNLGDKANARLIFTELIKKYPKSNEAQIAKKKLKGISH